MPFNSSYQETHRHKHPPMNVFDKFPRIQGKSIQIAFELFQTTLYSTLTRIERFNLFQIRPELYVIELKVFNQSAIIQHFFISLY